ncbi:MAG TPA: hypothetical protein VGJ09_06975 [Bryobacteraceae bacterium]
MRWAMLIFPVVAAAATPEFRVERVPVANGAELLTVFSSLPDNLGEIPLVSVLRDSLGDDNPDNDRLRYVWVLTSTRPTVLQHAAAFVPFFYWRPDLGKNMDRKPSAILDLGDTTTPVWNALAQSLVQTAAIDSNGALIRSSTRRYRTNIADQRQVNLMEGMSVLSQLENAPESGPQFSQAELLELQARLMLAGKTLGGLVHADKLPEAYLKNRVQIQETRGHNWELLRQRAEANGLYFEPLGFDRSQTHALLWVAREDLAAGPRKFDGRFLGIGDPFTGTRLKNWTGYSQTRYFDDAGRIVDSGAPGATPRELIPLALYGLDYPKVPLLLVDFRDTRKPKHREMLRLAAGDALSGVLGISKFGNWPYMTASWSWNFVRARHGDANNRVDRLRTYTQVRRWLALDGSIDPKLRAELQKRLETLGVNPLEESIFAETQIADHQYDALLRYAADPQGLPALVERDRNAEVAAHRHDTPARAGFRLAHWVTLGAYSHKETEDSAGLSAVLDRERRAARQVQFLETVAQSSSRPDVVWDLAEVRHAVDELIATGLPAHSAAVVTRIMQQTSDAQIRELCQQALDGIATAAGQ